MELPAALPLPSGPERHTAGVDFVYDLNYCTYSYSMAFYIQQDSENKDWNYCITESRRVMNGHKWDLFVLDLSFLGWYIVGMLCLGIGVLWVTPYHQMARAHFYETVILGKETTEKTMDEA